MFNENYCFYKTCAIPGKRGTKCTMYVNKEGQISMVDFIWRRPVEDEGACVNNPNVKEYDEVYGEDDEDYDFDALLMETIEIFAEYDKKGLEEICEKLKEGTVKTFCKKKMEQKEVMLPSEKRFCFSEDTVRGNVQYEVFIEKGRIYKVIQTYSSEYDTEEYYGMSDTTKKILKKCFEKDTATFRKIYFSLSDSGRKYLFENIIPYLSRYEYREWQKS